MEKKESRAVLHERAWPTPKDKYENLLLALLEQYTGAEEVWSYPVSLVLDPSSVCQLKCPFCINYLSPPIRERTLMSMELFQRIIDEIGRYLFKVSLFNWGEPFLNKYIVDMVRLLKGYGVDVAVSSHLSMPISDDTIDALIENGLDILTASIDGMTQESYSKYRVKGDIKLALSNMERFAKAKKKLGASKPHIDWQFLVFSFNEKELTEAKEFANRIGVDLRPAPPYVNVETHSHWLSSVDKYVMEIYKKKTQGIDSQSVDRLQQGIHGRIETLASQFYKGCDWHYLISTINANGSVSPCCGIMAEAEDFGSLADKMFYEVWNNDMYKTARRYLRTQCRTREYLESRNVCLNCTRTEIMGYGQDIVRLALLNAPSEIKEGAKRLMPRHPLVKEVVNTPVHLAYKVSQSVSSTFLQGFFKKVGKRILKRLCL